jgi:hypothetical protein
MQLMHTSKESFSSEDADAIRALPMTASLRAHLEALAHAESGVVATGHRYHVNDVS